MDTGTLIKRGFSIWWQHKALWIFGMLLVLTGRGSGISFNFNFEPDSLATVPAETIFRNLRAIGLSDTSPEAVVSWLITVSVVVLIAGIILTLVIGNLVEAAAIWQTDQANQGGQIDLAASFANGLRRLGTLIGVDLILLSPMLIPLIILIGSTIAIAVNVITMIGDGPGVDMLIGSVIAWLAVFICVGLIVFIYGIFLSLLRPLAARACVMEALGPVASLKRSWQLLRRQIGTVLVIWLITVGVGVVYALPVGTLTGIALLTSGANPLTNIGLWLSVTFALNLIFGVLIGGLINSLFVSLWTVAYRQWMSADTIARPLAVSFGD